VEAPNAVVITLLKLPLALPSGATGFAKGGMVGYAAVRNTRRCARSAVSVLGPFHRAGELEFGCLRTVQASAKGCERGWWEGPCANTCLAANLS